jgi:endonuclease/exonuclease/phosphatase family metal-dependent hydrolase
VRAAARRGALAVAAAAAAGLVLTSLPGPGASAGPQQRVTQPTSFRATSFNILGANHTQPGGNKAHMDRYQVRMNRTVKLLDDNRIDVAGLQEIQVVQYQELKRQTGSVWDGYPARELTGHDTHNTLVWRTATWTPVEKRAVAIPYFFGMKLQMPYVLLRHKATGQQVWFANFHNPASSQKRGYHSGWRALATEIQVALANDLRRTGHPVVFMGDMNEKGVYFCRMVTRTQMKAANGGSFGSSTCRTPPDMKIDWIFGSKELQFSGYQAFRSTLVKQTSDHPMIISDVTVPVAANR